MKRTTTPTHRFTLNINPTELDKLQITYAQTNKQYNCNNEQENILVKTLEDCVLGEDYVEVSLSQEETNLFSQGEISIQLHAKIDEDVFQSNIVKTFCYKVLNDEVL